MADATATPDAAVRAFWDSYITKTPGAVSAIFPQSLYATLLPRRSQSETKPFATANTSSSETTNALARYETVAQACRDRVARIAHDCRRTNTKFTDPDFDIKNNQRDCLLALNWRRPVPGANPGEVADAVDTLQNNGLVGRESAFSVGPVVLKQLLTRQVVTGEEGGDDSDDDEDVNADAPDFDPNPGSTHRVPWIFEKPSFTIDGYGSADIMQGANSEDCWFLSSIATICHRKDLMDRICVARDEECGIYGFVFQRDGEWESVVVDDYLFLTHPDFTRSPDEGGLAGYDPNDSLGSKYRATKQRGSEALYFAACKDPNETWLPLLEKAYAKLHGDYSVIWGGWIGEAVEDLTGGVHSEQNLEDILGKETLWKQLVSADGEFVFGLDILDFGVQSKNGLATGHAYSLLEAREETGEDGKKIRLVKVRNPWGNRADAGFGEWNGPWSDGSKEWTPYWLTKLGYAFGNDGIFWMTFDDMLATFSTLYRTRLFDDKWNVAQEWTSVNVAWLTGYQQRRFVVDVKKEGLYVFMLQQLDTRYFIGLEGQYTFELHFILQSWASTSPHDYIARVRPFSNSTRAASCEVELQPGVYEVLPKITGFRNRRKPLVEEVIQKYANRRPQKLREVGLSFDLAHRKVQVPEEEAKKEEKTEQKTDDEKKDNKEKGNGKKEGDKAETQQQPSAPVRAPIVVPIPTPTPSAPGEITETGPSQLAPGAAYGGDEGSVYGAESPAPAPIVGNPPAAADTPQQPPPSTPWNAVCVIGLKVYSRESDVNITVSEPRSAEEAASLVLGD